MTFPARSSLLISVLISTVLVGCTTTVYRPVPLPLIARPKLPAVKASAFQCPRGVVLPPPWTMCITDATYTALADRQNGYKTWGLEYEAEVIANNAKAGKAKL